MLVFTENGTTITGTFAKCIETGNGMLVNSQYIDKESLAPIPFEFRVFTGNYYSLSCSKLMFLQTPDPNHLYASTEPNVVQDSVDDTLFYVPLMPKRNTDTGVLYVLRERNYHIEHIKTILSSGTIQPLGILYQNNNYMWYIYHNSTTMYFMKYDKVSTNSTTLQSIAFGTCYPYVTFIGDTEQELILQTYNNNSYCFGILDKASNGAVTWKSKYRGENPNTTNVNFSPIIDKSATWEDEDYYYFYGVDVCNLDNPIDVYKLSKADKTISMDDYITTWTDYKTQLKIDNSVYSINNRCHIWVIEEPGVYKYLCICIYNQNFENVKHIQEQGIYVFDVDDAAHTVELKSFNSINGVKQIHSLLIDSTKRHIIIGFSNAFSIYSFNPDSASFVRAGDEITAYTVGIDKLDRVWYLTTSQYALHVINMNDAQAISIVFERDVYEYTGESINTYFIFNATNYLGEQFMGRFRLSIIGNAIFRETNTNTIEINFRGSPLKVYTIITGASTITVNTDYIGR